MPKLHTTITVPVTIHFDADIGERATCDSPEVPLSITINDVRIRIKGEFGKLREYNINHYVMLPCVESELEELVQENENEWRNE